MPKNKILILLILFLLYAGSAYAQKTIIISGVQGSDDSYAVIGILSEAYKRIGYDIEIKWVPGPEALESSNSGQVDAELQRIDGIAKKFTNLVQVRIPINFLQGAVFVKDVSFPVNGWFSLKPYRIGIVKGIIFAKLGTDGMDVKVADSYEGLMSMLENEEVDVAVMPRINGQVAMQKKGFENIRELEGVLETLFLYHYVHKKNSSLVPGLEKELKKMLLDGTIRQMRNDAYGQILNKDKPWMH
jgi:polar amino acid transport system substrate-binding protein